MVGTDKSQKRGVAMGRLENKVCLITGAARGQGAEEAKLFAAEGATVWMADVLDEEGWALAQSIGAEYRHLDVSDEAGWQGLIDEIIKINQGLDVLINNAGIFRIKRMRETTADDFNEIMSINALGVFLGMRICADPMAASGGGSMVNISSLAGLRAAAGSIAYGASKWAVRGMTKTAAVELARKGIRVNSIHPGLIDTVMVDDIQNQDRIVKRIPLGRLAEAREVANMALFLASDESSYSTGSEFVIDGGLSAL
jgi:3alpha(or 20beta)-hydroxysteroid dehydrogenase